MPVKDGLFPLGPGDVKTAIGVNLATVFASAAGIGGGAVLVPLFTLLGEFSEHEAIPLSLATVFGASVFSTFGTFLWLRHPAQPHRPMIAYDVAVALLPATLLGTTVGVFLNKICPNWMIMGLLVILCAVTGKRTLSRAFKAWARESDESARHASARLSGGLSESDEGEGTPAFVRTVWGVRPIGAAAARPTLCSHPRRARTHCAPSGCAPRETPSRDSRGATGLRCSRCGSS